MKLGSKTENLLMRDEVKFLKSVTDVQGRAMAQALIAGLSRQRLGIAPGSLHVEFMVEKVALEQALFRELLF
jgi:hypothetical protein